MYVYVLFLRLYGPLRVSVDDEVVIDEHFTRRKAKALLVLLYLERDSYIPRDELLEKLWPSRDALPADSGRLKQTVLVLRRALETGHSRRTGWQYIIEHDGTYVFDSQMSHDSDLEQMELALRQAESDRQQGDAPGALKHFYHAFGLRRTELLPEFRYEDWLAPYMLAEREAYVQALDDAARLHVELNEYPRAIDLLKRARREDLLRESSVLLLMESLRRNGEPAEAVRTYMQFRETLAKRLQLAPDPQLTALYRSIRRERGAAGQLPAAS